MTHLPAKAMSSRFHSTVPATSVRPLQPSMQLTTSRVWLLATLCIGMGGCATPNSIQSSNSAGSSALPVEAWGASATGGSVAGDCGITQATSDLSAFGATLSTGQTALLVKGPGACRMGDADAPVLLAVSATQPRLLGDANITIVHVGDVIQLQEGVISSDWKSADASAVQKALQNISLTTSQTKGVSTDLPKGSQPPAQLASLTGSILSFAGSYGYFDGKSADGTEVVRLMLTGAHVGEAQLQLQQDYQKDGRNPEDNTKGTRTLTLHVRVQDGAAPLLINPGELQLNPSDGGEVITHLIGQGDYLSSSVTLGFLSRLGSESRSAIGFQKKQ